MEKQPFNLEAALEAVEEAIRPYPQAGLFALMEEGYTSPFAILVACILSTRTLDEVMLAAAQRLFAKAQTPAEIAGMTPDEIAALIHPCSFYTVKARQLQTIAQRLTDNYEGALPCTEAEILSFTGVGPKCANLVLSIACNQPRIGVDIHVHRVVNRWGLVQTLTPEATLVALQAQIPLALQSEINRLLMPFGKHVCVGNRPRCSTCPVLKMCPQVGVTASR